MTPKNVAKVPLVQFAVISAVVVLCLMVLLPPHRLEVLFYKGSISLTIGPCIGLALHHFCFPSDRHEPISEQARWRRLILIGLAMLSTASAL